MSAAGKIETLVAQPPHMAAPHDEIIAEEEEYEYVVGSIRARREDEKR